MTKLKILVALLSSVLVFSSANAGEVTVNGSVKASIAAGGSDSTAGASETGESQTLAVSNDLSFDATGEMDNGWTWKWQTQLDAGAIDDTRLEITTGGMGTIGLYGTEGGLNFKHGGSQMALGYGSQVGSSGGLVDPDDIGSFNNLQYHTPAGALPLETSIKVGVSAGGSATSEPGDAPLAAGADVSEENGSTIQIDTAPIDGLKVGATYFKVDQSTVLNEAGQEEENGAYYASYKVGAFGIGYSRALHAPALAGTPATAYNQYDTRSISAGFVVNDDLSISAGIEKSARNLVTDADEFDLKITVVQAAYNMGGMTMTVGMKDIENASYVENADQNEAHLVLSMAF